MGLVFNRQVHSDFLIALYNHLKDEYPCGQMSDNGQGDKGDRSASSSGRFIPHIQLIK
jgi:hypothetical protein